MEKNLLISAIVPVYNIDTIYLTACIESILNQTYLNFEIIIVDDGSNKEYGDALEIIKTRDFRIKVFHKENQGVSAARNFGIQKSAGDYITFIDGDDLLTPYYFEEGIKAAAVNDADIVIGQVCNTRQRSCQRFMQDKNVKIQGLDEEDKICFQQHVFSKKERDWGKSSNEAAFNFEGCWAHIIKRKVAEREPFVEGISVGEDTIWALQISDPERKYKIYLIYSIWYLYIQNDNSVLHTYKASLPEVLTRVNEIIFPMVSDKQILSNQYYDWIFVKLRQIIHNYLSNECPLTIRKKMKNYSNMVQLDIWKRTLENKTFIPRKYRGKCKMFRSSWILIYFAMKNSVLNRHKISKMEERNVSCTII